MFGYGQAMLLVSSDSSSCRPKWKRNALSLPLEFLRPT